MRLRDVGRVRVVAASIIALVGVSACSPPPTTTVVSNPRSIVGADPCHFFTDAEITFLINGSGFGFPLTTSAKDKYCQLPGVEGGVEITFEFAHDGPDPGLFHDMIAGNAAAISEHTGTGCMITVKLQPGAPFRAFVDLIFDHVDHPSCKKAVPVVAAAINRLPRG